MGRICIIDLVDSEKDIWGCMKIKYVVSEVLKTAISILIPVSIMYIGCVFYEHDLIASALLVILFWVSIWFVLNYTCPEWFISLLVSLFVVDIGSFVVKNVIDATQNMNFHYPIRSKKRRFIIR